MFIKTLLFLCSNNSYKMNRIKEVLEEKGIKQKWLAEKLGKSYNMVNAYVQNRKQPRLEVLYDIAKILDVDAGDLLIKMTKRLYKHLLMHYQVVNQVMVVHLLL